MSIESLTIKYPDAFEHSATIRAYVGPVYVGIVRLTREGPVATLQDIEIKELPIPLLPFTTWPKRKRSFRRKGYGSGLLKATIEFCRAHGIEVLEGMAFGDLEFLLPWYARHGFDVSDRNRIVMRLTLPAE